MKLGRGNLIGMVAQQRPRVANTQPFEDSELRSFGYLHQIGFVSVDHPGAATFQMEKVLPGEKSGVGVIPQEGGGAHTIYDDRIPGSTVSGVIAKLMGQ